MHIINLLPKTRQQELYYERILKSLYVVVSFSVASFALVFLVQIGAKMHLQKKLDNNMQSIERLKSQINKKDNADVRAKIKTVNDTIADYKNLADSSPKWSKVLKQLSTLPPKEVKISSFSVDASKKVVNISGVSQTREAIIQFYYNIKGDDKNFSNVDHPLDYLSSPTNAPFHFTFGVQDALLK
jgi:Tfp pilus assembly protein PilN